MKKYLCISSIVLITVIQAVVHSSDYGIAKLFGSLLPALIIGLLFSKYLDKNADKDKKLLIFTVAYCSLLILVIINDLNLI